MFFSQRFILTFRDIFERALLAVGLSISAVVLHFARVACEKAQLSIWIVFLVDYTFDLFVLIDCLTLVTIAVALPIRLVVDTFRELKAFIKQ